MEQRVPGTLQIWAEPFVTLRVPKLFNLRTDPFERADITSNTYWDWLFENDYIILAATATRRASSCRRFQEFPPRQKAASFTIDQVVEKLESVLTSGRVIALLLERRRGADGDPRLRRSRQRGGRRGLRAARRARSRCSTTTGRCGASGRPTSRRCSSSPACATRSRPGPSWPSGRWSRRCSPATSRPRSSSAWRRSPACCSSSTPGSTTEEFAATPRTGSPTAEHPRFGVPFRELTYAPMLELMDLLRARGFRVFIVTGGGVEFVRAVGEELYGVAPDDVVGSAVQVDVRAPRRARRARAPGGDARLAERRAAEGGATSRPTSAAGRSWPPATAPATARCSSTRTPASTPSLCLVVDHDDAEREYAYAGRRPPTRTPSRSWTPRTASAGRS